MNSRAIIELNDQKIQHRHGMIRLWLRTHGISLDIILIFFILALVNLHLIRGGFNNSLLFLPHAVGSGEWWRVFSHPFIHITWYHLLLDAGAFFLLYREFTNNRISTRIFYVMVCGIFSLVATLFASPLIYERGLCGLSGIAHGLMAISGLELMRQKEHFRVGLITFVLVVAKSMYEAIAGNVFFEFMHMGLCGSPLAVSHAGGVLGGIIGFSIVMSIKRIQRIRAQKPVETVLKG
jgi:rhomboid family GlyGly-CTERM serine protease